jgi:hypothetical protein
MTVHSKKLYIGGKIVHRKSGGTLLDLKKIVHISKKVDDTIMGRGLPEVALRRLEALKPHIDIPKRQNIKF